MPPAVALQQPQPEPVPAGARVPVEWIGRGRVLLNRIGKAHARWTKAAEALTEPLLPRDDFQPQFTQQSLRLLRARWQRLPEWGRLKMSTKIRDTSAQIVETRLIPFRMMMADWAEPELSVAVALFVVDMRLPATLTVSQQILAAVSLHALARRFERGEDRADRAVLRSLYPITSAWPEIVRAGGDFEIAALGGGRWIGTTMHMAGKPILAIRTFVD